MSDYTIEEVGFENLPNVYVNNIVVNRVRLRQYEIYFFYKTVDFLDNPSWSISPYIDYMDVAFTLRVEKPDGVVNRYKVVSFNKSVNEYTIMAITHRELFPLYPEAGNNFYPLDDGTEDSLYKVFLEAKMELNLQKLSQDYGLNFPSQEGFNHYSGPSTVSQLFQYKFSSEEHEYVITKVSGIKYFTTNNTTVPPIYHVHEGNYMNGSRHRSTPHFNISLTSNDDVDKVYYEDNFVRGSADDFE